MRIRGASGSSTSACASWRRRQPPTTSARASAAASAASSALGARPSSTKSRYVKLRSRRSRPSTRTLLRGPAPLADDEVDPRVGRQHETRPAALGQDDALPPLARVDPAHVAGSAVAGEGPPPPPGGACPGPSGPAQGGRGGEGA